MFYCSCRLCPSYYWDQKARWNRPLRPHVLHDRLLPEFCIGWPGRIIATAFGDCMVTKVCSEAYSACHCESFNFLWQWKPWCHLYPIMAIFQDLRAHFLRVSHGVSWQAYASVFGWHLDLPIDAGRIAETCASLVFQCRTGAVVVCKWLSSPQDKVIRFLLVVSTFQFGVL